MPTPRATTLKPGTRAERFLTVDRAAVNLDARTVELSFASETPYERWWGIEVLDCTAQSVRLQRLMSGAPLLWNHDTDEQIGVVESVTIGADRICRAVVRFSKNAEADEVFVDVADGICRNVSVGYIIHKADVVSAEGDPNTGDNSTDTYRVTDWEPFEVSIVPVPADPSVGIGRSADDPRLLLPAPLATAPHPAAPAALAPAVPAHPTETRQMPASLNLSEEAAAARAAETTRMREINALGETFEKFGARKIAAAAVESGATLDATRALVMNAMAAAQTQNITAVGLSRSEVQRYSVLRAIRTLVDPNYKGGDFERAVSQAICQRGGFEASPNGGFFVPTEVQHRDLTAATATAGGNLVATDLQASSFIELLRARSVLAGLGATMLPGLVGNVAIPKQTGSATGYWLTNEATAITESQQTIGQLALTPRNLGAYTELSRQLMMQSTPAADAMVMNDLARVLALSIDLAGLEGSGAAGQPTGIANTAGIGSVTGTSMAYAGILEFQTDVAGGNALASNSAYLTTPAVAALLLARQRFASTDSPLWAGSVLDGTVSGFSATTTTQMTAASMIFGDYSQVVIAEWSFLELALNPYANFTAAISGIRAIQTVDIGIRQAAAFSRATSIT